MGRFNLDRERIRTLLDSIETVRADQVAAALNLPRRQASQHLACMAYEGELRRVPLHSHRCRSAYRRAA